MSVDSLRIVKRFYAVTTHRQWRHRGHCAYYHGDFDYFDVEFVAQKLDECGFILDFGNIPYIKVWFAKMFDHTLLLEKDDPAFEEILKWDNRLAQIRVVPSSSAEGLAKYVAEEVNKLVTEFTQGRVQVRSVAVYENKDNSAYYERKVIWVV